MGRHKSPEEVKEEHLHAMGPQLGPLYHALYNEVAWLHAKWLQYRQLYAHSPKRIDLLNEVSGFFFRVVQNVLWEDVLLHLARLTDPPKSVGKTNLTLLRIRPAITESSLAEEVHKLVEVAVSQSSFARDLRNRRLAHLDLDLALGKGAKPLPGISRQNVENALSAIRDVLNRLAGHYLDTTVGFEHFISHDNGEALVYHLRVVAHIEKLRRERLLEGKLSLEDLEPPPDG